MGGHENIFDKGSNAYHSGASFSDNPYPAGCANHKRWSAGWIEAKAFENVFSCFSQKVAA